MVRVSDVALCELYDISPQTQVVNAWWLSCACRPDNRCWRAFGALSGGQQALASLALTFALQVCMLSILPCT